MAEFIENQPHARTLIDSMRSIGYSFNTAIADVIDNSLSANAKNVWLYFDCNKDDDDALFAFLDDGSGMTKSELINALKYGSIVESKRNSSDLGRFGLGLKTASLSQCRKLTVITKQNNDVFAAAWSLDHIAKTNRFETIMYTRDELEKLPLSDDLLKLETGTLVVWEDFDVMRQVIKSGKGKTFYSMFNENIFNANKYISLIFHRFLNGTNGAKKVNFFSNGTVINGLDPFLSNHPKTTIISKTTSISCPTADGSIVPIEFQAVVLPYYKDLDDDDYILVGGRENIHDWQGFFVYRCNRLIDYGKWYGARPESKELTQYARIILNIPNTLDETWGIDIKKERAIIPPHILNLLKGELKASFNVSKKKVKHRAEKIMNKNIDDLVWIIEKDRNGSSSLRINTAQPIISKLMEAMDGPSRKSVEKIMLLLEMNIPFEWICSVVENKQLKNNQEDEEAAINLALSMIKDCPKEDRSEFVELLGKISSHEDVNVKNRMKEFIENE